MYGRRRVLRILFPPRCAGCGAGAWPFCEICHRTLVAFAPPWCATCGLPSRAPRDTCAECLDGSLDAVRSAFLFEGAARSAVHRLKFSGWRPVAAALGSAMSPLVADARGDHVLTWVPLSRRRLASRGFDQARLLAEAVARRTGAPARRLLVRTTDVGPQARRSGADRRAAVPRSFGPTGPAPASVILVDDVVTTGATAAACADVLRVAGARRIVLLTAARSASAPMPRRYTRDGPARGAVVAREEASR